MTIDPNELRVLADASAPAGDALRDAARDAADEIERMRADHARLRALLVETRLALALDGWLERLAAIEAIDVALGGEKYPLQLIEDTTGTTIWRFGEDA